MEPAQPPTPAEPTGDSQNTERRLSNLSSSSFSSSTSSFNSLLDINEYENENGGDIIINRADSQLTFRTPQSSLVIKDQTDPLEDTPVSASQLAQSPVSEMMDKTFVGYDPSRIPSSVFSRKPTGQMEWSVASNESLFSIHMGNNSFSLGKSDELLFPYDYKQQPTIQPQPSPVTSEGVITKPPEIVVVNDEETSHANNRVGSLDNRLGDDSTTSTAYFSDEIGNTSNSFVFPLLTNDVSNDSGKSAEAAPPPPAPAPAAVSSSGSGEEAAASLWKEEEEKSKGEEATAATSGGNEEKKPENKTWLSYLSCFSFCPTNLPCFGRVNSTSNGNGNENGKGNENGIQPETKPPETKTPEIKI